MKRMIIQPRGWPCAIRDCPPGFFVSGDALCFKTEYGAMETAGPTNVPGSEMRWTVGSQSDVYCSSGESFWGGATTKEEVEKLQVQPVAVEWSED